MLSSVFKQQILLILITLFLPVAIGCGSKTVDFTVSQRHPANPDAQQGLSDNHHNISNAEMHEISGGHGSVELSPDGTKALAAMLDAYFAIGDRLASDVMEGVNRKAHTMLKAFHTLEGKASAELWRAHASYTARIRDTGHQLAELSDIKAARVVYGSLSDSFKYFIDALGIPTSYDKAVYSYVCGMAADVPESGIWLQTGEPARNPYFGSAMLRCHTSKTEMSVSSTDMSGTTDMESHKHSH